jgi:glycosyltransferase involved in cell wall biosynthesis
MKVLMVTPTYLPITGGAETAIQRLSIDLNSIGIQTDVMTFNMEQVWNAKWHGKTEISENGFRIFRIPGLNWLPIAHSNRIAMGVNLIPGRFSHVFADYDIIHFHIDLSFPLFSWFSKKSKIFHFHGWDGTLKRNFPSRFILKHTGDIFISLTKQMKTEIAELGIAKEEKIICLPNSVNPDAFYPFPEKKERNLLLFIGRITSGKGLHILLQSLQYLKTPVRLVIIGPADWDFTYFNHIQKFMQAENSKGKHKVEYIGRLEHRELVKWYQSASILILPSTSYEAFPVVNLEALSCETPVIATKIGGVSEVVHSGENGLLVTPNSVAELANAIQCLLDDDALRLKLGKEGRRQVLENYSNTVIVEKLRKIYEELVESQP